LIANLIINKKTAYRFARIKGFLYLF